MHQVSSVETRVRPSGSEVEGERARLLAGLPVTERTWRLADIPTAVLLGGSGPPLVLLHGPGESAVNWRWVIPELTREHRVVAPDLPAHGRSGGTDERLDEPRVVAWLGALIERAGSPAPAVVGHLLGGAIAIRYAIGQGERLGSLVLVDSLGLGRFRPSPGFLLTLLAFQIRPTRGSYRRFMRRCAYDLDTLRDRMGERWETFVAYNLDLARAPKTKEAARMLRSLGLPRIPPRDVEKIQVPTSLIWGRYDRAVKLRVAKAASDRYGWPLHVIDEAADDPPRDQPEAFLDALRLALAGG